MYYIIAFKFTTYLLHEQLDIFPSLFRVPSVGLIICFRRVPPDPLMLTVQVPDVVRCRSLGLFTDVPWTLSADAAMELTGDESTHLVLLDLGDLQEMINKRFLPFEMLVLGRVILIGTTLHLHAMFIHHIARLYSHDFLWWDGTADIRIKDNGCMIWSNT